MPEKIEAAATGATAENAAVGEIIPLAERPNPETDVSDATAGTWSPDDHTPALNSVVDNKGAKVTWQGGNVPSLKFELKEQTEANFLAYDKVEPWEPRHDTMKNPMDATGAVGAGRYRYVVERRNR